MARFLVPGSSYVSVTAMYAQGVGLGAAKAREIGKFSEGYSGYVQQAQEAVSSNRKYGDALSTLSIQNDVLNFTVHVRLANAMEVEAFYVFGTLFISWFRSSFSFFAYTAFYLCICFNKWRLNISNSEYH